MEFTTQQGNRQAGTLNLFGHSVNLHYTVNDELPPWPFWDWGITHDYSQNVTIDISAKEYYAPGEP